MKRLAVITAIFIFLFLGLVISNLLAVGETDVLGVGVLAKQDVFVMFGFGVAAVTFLALYDVFAAFGTFRSRRELQKQIERLESELLSSKPKPPPTTY